MTGDEKSASYASPPCFLHELSAEEGGLPGATDPVQARDVARWRKAERNRLLADRATLSVTERKEAAEAVASHLDTLFGDVAGFTISAWWPIQSELDLRFWLAALSGRGATAALPLVTEKHAPLRFRRWTPRVKMERGFWNIPVPAEGDWIIPDIALAPLVGYDAKGYRLGYGGGYFDRTLAAHPEVRPIGIGLSAARQTTIFPQWHDVPMTAIVTEEGIV
ncbi:5-formyltetrahydrofolate cyclo-ligase [Defluviimonas sp. WL0050]|uniref:5-formyltetrahydrofolate cyclo-ligase n=1 Tax=Albidovulum litorale TaxID=2984134 RepID=A0ABT2ZTH2_9RHOB|nr:5-formyltetrahydrofolate cyclo-ligase [Defluviimonas sp. WL0050]MCV2874429.1 5-formyltetrahydrofolate cyclo-ligase [Defluviimonas sp. WL0050]